MTDYALTGWLGQLRKRGVLRVAAGYAVIGWLLLQIADVTFEPLGAAKWAMTALIFAVLQVLPVLPQGVIGDLPQGQVPDIPLHRRDDVAKLHGAL